MSQNIFCIEIYRMCHYILGGRGDPPKFYHVFMMTWGPKKLPSNPFLGQNIMITHSCKKCVIPPFLSKVGCTPN